MLQNNGMDWEKAEWTDAAVNLYREGVATYVSKQIVKGLNESVYYSYDDDGERWLQYYIENEEQIKKRFLKDYIEGWTFEKRKSGFGYLADNILDTTDSVIFRNSFCRICCTSIGRVKYLLLEQTQFEKRCNGLVIEMNQIMIGG